MYFMWSQIPFTVLYRVLYHHAQRNGFENVIRNERKKKRPNVVARLRLADAKTHGEA